MAAAVKALRTTLVTSLILAGALLLGSLSLTGEQLPRLAVLACLSLIMDLFQPRAGRRAFRILTYNAALYTAVFVVPGGTAALLGLAALAAGLLRGQAWRDALTRGAVMAISGLTGGIVVDQVTAYVPGWPGELLALAAAAAVVIVVTFPWNPIIGRGWRTVGTAEIQAAAAGWLVAHHLAGDNYVAVALTSGLFIFLRRHLLRRTDTAARNWWLARREQAWTQGMEVVRDVARRLDVAPTAPALTEALADGVAELPGVAGVAVWEAPATRGPLRLAAYGRRRPEAARQSMNGDGDMGQATTPAVTILSAVPPPGVSQALQQGGPLHIDDLCYIPLRDGGTIQSVAEITLQSGTDVGLVQHMVGAIADYFRARLKHLDLLGRAQDDFLATVRVLAATVDARDHYTHQHSENVSALARRIALEMGLEPAQAAEIAMAGLLHDVGKIGIPDAVLTKKGPLDVAERQLMMSHAELGAGIVMQAEPLVHLAPLIRHHHEWHDGNGYPDGLKGDKIPLGAAIIAVADAYDTMTTDRPYRTGVSVDVACGEIGRCAGTQFHPDVAAAAVRVIGRTAADATLSGRWALPVEANRTLAGRHHQAQYIAVRMLQRLSAEMSLVLNLEELLTRSLAIIRDEMGFTTGALLLRDSSAKVVLRAATGFLAPWTGTALPPGRGLTGWVIEHGRALRVDDVTKDPRYFGGPGSDPVRSELAVPLTVDGRTLGCLIVSSERINGFTDQDEALLTAAAGPLAAAVQVAILHEAQVQPAETDNLTGLMNRRGLVLELSAAVAGATADRPIHIAAFDVCDLKVFNQQHGFRAGDAALVSLAAHIDKALGPEAVLGRFNGDQFVALLPTESAPGAETFVQTIVADWEKTELELDGVVHPVPRIVGGLAISPTDFSRLDDVINWADNFPWPAAELAQGDAAATAGD